MQLAEQRAVDEDGHVIAGGDNPVVVPLVLAKQHGIPFYVAAPLSTVDMNCPTGDEIPIEERDPIEVTHVRDIQLAPKGIGVSNYAFDVTPNEFVTAIITEKGVARAPYTESLKAQFES